MKNLNTHLYLTKKYFNFTSLRDVKQDRSDGHISDEQYQHLQNVWDIFNFNTFEDFHDHTTGTVKKLVPNLINKNNYVIYYRNLQQCLELGIKLKKMHKILKFKQRLDQTLYWF